MLFEIPLGFVVHDHVMQYVEEFGGADGHSKFFANLPDRGLFMPFAMVDSASGQVEFPYERSTRLSNEDHSRVREGNDGVRTGADRQDVGHGKKIRK